jgi:hypothetical protein
MLLPTSWAACCSMSAMRVRRQRSWCSRYWALKPAEARALFSFAHNNFLFTITLTNLNYLWQAHQLAQGTSATTITLQKISEDLYSRHVFSVNFNSSHRTTNRICL